MSWWRYYHSHFAIATILSIMAYWIPYAFALAGFLFYLGREIRDWEKLGFIDWPGILFPFYSSLIIFLLAWLYKI